jgi:hypothetical protein
MASNGSRTSDVLERGHIFFFYRPRVHSPDEEPLPNGLEDVERSYIVLNVKGKDLYRLLVIGRKRLPDVDKHEKEWAFVYKVSRKLGAIEEELAQEEYETKTRGDRVRSAARPAGEGVYTLSHHEEHTHLAYVLELPKKPGPVQRALQIESEASYVVAVKNPEASWPPEAGLTPDEAAKYPKRLTSKFQGRRFLSADPPDFLNYPGTQIMVIGASADLREEFDLDLDPEHETARAAELFKDLRLDKSEFPVEPLLKGRWE